MRYYTENGWKIPLSLAVSAIENIAYFTLGQDAFFTYDENGENSQFSEWKYADAAEYQALLQELAPYQKKRYCPEEWFLRGKVPPEHQDEYLYYVLVYPFNEETYGILGKYTQNIMMSDDEDNSLHLPEDLCFFDETGKMLLGTLSHTSTTIIDIDQPIEETVFKEYGFTPCDDPRLVIPQLDLK